MDRETLLRHQALAERHVAESTERVAKQRALWEDLQRIRAELAAAAEDRGK